MSARKTSSSPRTQSPSNAEQIKTTENNFPPSRKTPMLRDVSAPLSSTRLSRLIYLLITLTVVLGAYYSYRVVQYKREIGGWWSLAMGKTPAQVHERTQASADPTSSRVPQGGRGGRKGENEVEDRINALAEALGMPSNELASAIAGAVKAYVPPATLSSVAAKQTGEAVKVLLKEQKEDEAEAPQRAEEDQQPGLVEGMVHGMGSFVGMDEP